MRAITTIAFCILAVNVLPVELNLIRNFESFSSHTSSSRSVSSSESNANQLKLWKPRKGSVFGPVETKVYIRNVKFDRVIEDEALNPDWQGDSKIYPKDKTSKPRWNQVLIIRRRGNDKFYSLAFDRKNVVKVITDEKSNTDNPISKLYNESDSSKAQWKLTYVDDVVDPGQYQIISVSSGLAISMWDTDSLLLLRPDTTDRRQLWNFMNAETNELVYYNNDPTKCPEGSSEEYPTVGSKCYTPDTGIKRADPATCAGYLICKPDNCTWIQEKCPVGKYYNQHKQDCVPRLDADCTVSIFGRHAKAVKFIENAEYNMVISDCQGCYGGDKFPSMSPVVGSARYPGLTWNQTLIAKNRVDSGYFRLAFHRSEHHHFKVLVEVEGEVGSNDVKNNTFVDMWRIIPTEDPVRYQILSVETKRALAMTKQVSVLSSGRLVRAMEMQKVDENNMEQLWTFREATPESKPYPGFSVSSLSSSEEMSEVRTLGGSGRQHCQSIRGVSKRNPIPNSKCYRENVDRRTSSPNSCKSYLECDPKDCEWREHLCSGSRYWNNAKKKCDEGQQHATCGAAIFGPESKVSILNYYCVNLLSYDRQCQQDPCPVTGTAWERSGNPFFVAKRLEDDEFYSLAFEKGADGQVKFLTDNGGSLPVAMTYNPYHSSPAQWKFVPISFDKDAYQIISITSNKALAMYKIGDQVECQVRLVQPNQQDRKQQWAIEDADELLSARNQQRNQNQNGNALPE